MCNIIRALAVTSKATPFATQRKVDHLASTISKQVAKAPLRQQYQQLADQKREEAMFTVQMVAHTSYSYETPELTEHLATLSEGYKKTRMEDKARTQASTPEFLVAAINHRDSTDPTRVDQAKKRESKTPIEIIESATRTNPDPERYFKTALLSYLPVAPHKHVKDAEEFAHANGALPYKEDGQ